jgi:hypothetical protein
MALTFDQAYTVITDHLQTQWTALTPAIVGSVPELRFDGVEKPGVPETTFARFVMSEVSSPRNTLRNAEYGQRFENNGIIILQLLVDRTEITAASIARKLGDMAKNIFRDPAFPGCFIFRNIRVNTLESEPKFLRRNVIVEYQFDELT